MIYNVEFIARFAYTVNADNIGDAENAGYKALENDPNVGEIYAELYCIDTENENGAIIDTKYFY